MPTVDTRFLNNQWPEFSQRIRVVVVLIFCPIFSCSHTDTTVTGMIVAKEMNRQLNGETLLIEPTGAQNKNKTILENVLRNDVTGNWHRRLVTDLMDVILFYSINVPFLLVHKNTGTFWPQHMNAAPSLMNHPHRSNFPWLTLYQCTNCISWRTEFLYGASGNWRKNGNFGGRFEQSPADSS